MKSVWWIVLVIAMGLAGGAGGYWYARAHAARVVAEKDAPDDSDKQDDKPPVPVTVTPLTLGTITETEAVYGSIVAEPADVRALSVSYESRVLRVLITPGQRLKEGDPVVRVEPSPDAKLALIDAKNAADAAKRDLEQTQQRFNDHLATNQELSAALQAAQTTELKFKTLTERSTSENEELKATAAGVVSKIDVQEGQIVQPGAALVEIAAGDRIEAPLGVEPEDAIRIKGDQTIELHRVERSGGGAAVVGKVRTVGQRVDPTTRLVEVRVTLPPDSELLLESYVAGEIDRTEGQAMVVPRNAALPGDEGFVVFTVRDNKAVKHIVKLGLQNDRDVQIITDDLKTGDAIVTSGNYVLEDGAAVSIEAPSTQLATSEPAGNAAEDKQ